MKLLHLKGKDIDEYIAIDKIERFQIFEIENTIRYTVDIIVGNRPSPLAINTSEPQEIVKSLLKVINTIDNEIIEYTVKEAE